MASRRDLLKSLGLAGFGGLAGAAGLAGVPAAARTGPRLAGVAACTPDCVLMPSVTQGPYYFDAGQMRRDITEGFPGVATELVIGVVNVDTCQPVAGAIVDVWHCNATGLYSGYNQPGGNTTGQDFLRGIQTTDANGEAAFDTIYPGWYSGRAIHIHLKVRFNQTTYVTSQLFFPDSVNATICTTQPPYSSRGLPNVHPNSQDNLYQGTANRERMLMTVTGEPATGLTASIVIGVAGLATAAETVAPTPQPELAVPFPNPTPSVATLWLTLPRPASHARVVLYDVRGREVALLHAGPLVAGRHPVEVDAGDLAPGTYAVRADIGSTVLVQPLTVAR